METTLDKYICKPHSIVIAIAKYICVWRDLKFNLIIGMYILNWKKYCRNRKYKTLINRECKICLGILMYYRYNLNIILL